MTTSKTNDTTIFVGNKPIMNYVTSVVMQLSMEGANEVIVKARGKNISKAVDIAEVVRKRFNKDVKLGNISLGSESFKSNNNNKQVRVSTIEIPLLR